MSTDDSGKLIKSCLERAGHRVIHYDILGDEMSQIQAKLRELIGRTNVQAIILNGGTGVSSKDVTIEAVVPYIDKWLHGFGELFRYLSYREVGSASMLSRAIAGVTGAKVANAGKPGRDDRDIPPSAPASARKVIFCLPGSPNAVKLGVEKLIIPELGHIIWEINR
jgi:molybdenum cofactor biosynthesis protein B